MGSRKESCDGVDACALGLQKGTIIDSDQLLMGSVTQQVGRFSHPTPFPTSLPLLGLPSDVIGVGPDVGG